MLPQLNRRDFGQSAAIGALGLAGGSLWGWDLFADDPPPVDNRLVLLGLNALARSPELDYFSDGHRGASLIAAHLMCQENHFDEAARARIVQLFDLNWAAAPLCQPFPENDSQPAGIARIGEALLERGDVLLQVGHNVIFAMLAIKAFRMVPEAATPERIDGVCRLIRSFTPWHDIPPAPEVDPPPLSDSQAASRFVLREALDSVERFIGFGQGFAGHMLTFGQALVELAAMGDAELADGCRTAFCKYVTVTRQGPDPDARRITDHKPSQLRPSDTKYWEQRGDKTLGIGHVFKYPYSYYDLLRRANDPELQAAWDAKAYHLF